MRSYLTRLAAIVLLSLLLAAFVQQSERIAAWLAWMEQLGPVGDLLFAAFYVAATLLMVPASILEASAGFLYGAAWGIPIASLLGTFSTTCSFLLGRTLLRGVIERRVARDPRWAAVDAA